MGLTVTSPHPRRLANAMRVALAAAIFDSRDQIIAVASPWGRALWR